MNYTEPNKTKCDQLRVELRPFMTVEEACVYLDISKSSLYKYMHRRLIPYYKPNNKKAYFKHEDLDYWVFNNRVNSDGEIIGQIDFYLQQKGKSRNKN